MCVCVCVCVSYKYTAYIAPRLCRAMGFAIVATAATVCGTKPGFNNNHVWS